jgi:tripartite-type tricarboxylate transporter receptor subunit TctC
MAIASKKRSPLLPDVPTSAEQGMPQFDMAPFYAVFAPKGTPKPIIDRIQQEMAKGFNSPKLKQQLAAQGAEPSTNTPAEFAAFLQQEGAKWAAVAKSANIQPE